MGLTNEHVRPKILAKIKNYALTRAELPFNLCYEIPCTCAPSNIFVKSIGPYAAMVHTSKLPKPKKKLLSHIISTVAFGGGLKCPRKSG